MTVIATTDAAWKDSNIDGMKVRQIMGPDQGAGAVTMGELDFTPGAVLPLHKHLIEEAFRIYEGSGVALVGDREIPIAAGDAVLAPAGVPHGFRNDSSGQLKMTFFYPAINAASEFVE
ncbi:MAG TPA: cupin domain-containing protein [Chloroflexota bacterium]|nr:cupin domain-containing protein [Chloroflexota bacterium]